MTRLRNAYFLLALMGAASGIPTFYTTPAKGMDGIVPEENVQLGVGSEAAPQSGVSCYTWDDPVISAGPMKGQSLYAAEHGKGWDGFGFKLPQPYSDRKSHLTYCGEGSNACKSFSFRSKVLDMTSVTGEPPVTVTFNYGGCDNGTSPAFMLPIRTKGCASEERFVAHCGTLHPCDTFPYKVPGENKTISYKFIFDTHHGETPATGFRCKSCVGNLCNNYNTVGSLKSDAQQLMRGYGFVVTIAALLYVGCGG